MLETLIWITAAVCIGGALLAYVQSRDVFHPALLLSTLCLFVYGYLPYQLLHSDALFTYVTVEQALFAQTLVILGLVSLFLGLLLGSTSRAHTRKHVMFSTVLVQHGAYWIGAIGFLAWLFTIQNAGGLIATYSRAYSSGWSENGYIRDAVYLLLVALLLLLSPEGYAHRTWRWTLAVTACAIPWLAQAILGARRGPTFVLFLTIGMSWYLARRTRPPVMLALGVGIGVGLLMLFLVSNRGSIYIGSDLDSLDFNVAETVTSASAANEYIFGVGCIATAKQVGSFYWGKRYLAQVLVRPIPRQLWPNKYSDVGLEALEYNAGVALPGMEAIMGWSEVPGAAAAMIADLWVEFSWGLLPVLLGIGYMYGRTWRLAVEYGGAWTTQFVILCALSVYLVTQSGEAVIFRLVILSLPTWYVWRRARIPAAA